MNVTSSTPGRNVLSFKLSGSEKMRIASDGSVGIGTAAPATTLDVSGTTTLKGTTNLSNNNIISIGNVGIGTAAPAYKLDVIGSGSDNIVCRLQSGGANTYTTYVNTGASNLDVGTGSGGHFVYGYGSYPLYFGVNGSEKMRITSAGNVGIGTSAPTSIHHIYGSLNNALVSTIENASSDSSSYAQFILKTDQTNVFSIFKNSSTRTSDGGVNTTTIRNDGGKLRLQSNIGEGITISGGLVGIGTSTPRCQLDVLGGTYQTGSLYGGQYGSGGYAPKELYNTELVTARFDYWIGAAGLQATSDKRIKHNITQIEKDNALNILRELNPVKYEYKENVIHGTYYGFIAQEIENILKTSVKYNRNFIPNIQSFADYTKIENNKYNIKCQNPITFESKNPLPYTIRVYYDDNYSSNTATIIEIISSNEFIIETSPDISFNKCYIYGQEVDDYRTLVYDHIFTVATAALQEVDRQQQADKARIAELETEIVSLKQELDKQQTLINSILERLAI
jgi:hypothetical protein